MRISIISTNFAYNDKTKTMNAAFESSKGDKAPQKIANNMESSLLIHPGEMIKDEIGSRGISQRKLADMTGISPSVLNEVLNAKRSVSTEYALLFEAALGIDADIWIGLQNDYDKQKAKADKLFSERLVRIRKMAAML